MAQSLRFSYLGGSDMVYIITVAIVSPRHTEMRFSRQYCMVMTNPFCSLFLAWRQTGLALVRDQFRLKKAHRLFLQLDFVHDFGAEHPMKNFVPHYAHWQYEFRPIGCVARFWFV